MHLDVGSWKGDGLVVLSIVPSALTVFSNALTPARGCCVELLGAICGVIGRLLRRQKLPTGSPHLSSDVQDRPVPLAWHS